MKCSRENVILREIFHVVSCFPLHFMLYRGNLDDFSDSVRILWACLSCTFIERSIMIVDYYDPFDENLIILRMMTSALPQPEDIIPIHS